MHAATSIVGNLAQVQTHSGSVYEGIFRTFSPNFDVAVEYAQCVKNNQNQNSDASSIAECMIFPPVHLVSITAKNVDLDFATSGNFQTDSAISARCNGSRSEERELEPWDPTGSAINGELDLELDGNANGWDANEMFNKNEKLYGVQSTFDQSLTGYTVQIEKKDTQDYKEAEEQAEKIAKEIENQANYQERIELENGDEESRFAAVERPSDQSPDISRENTNINPSNTNMSKGSSNDKHMVPSKRKSLQSGKIRSTPPPNNNNGPIPQHNAHNSNKNNNYQSMQMQQGPTQYMISPNYPHNMHGHPTNMSQAKMNGEGNLNNTSSKSMPQRGIRQYPSQASTPNSYSDNQSMSGQMSMGKQPMHMSQNHGHIQSQHMAGGLQETQQPPPTSHMTVHSNMVNAPPNTVGNVMPAPQNQPPPQPQRPPRDPRREEQIQELRKFQQDFNLSTTNQQQHPPPMNQVKTPSVSPHPPQPSLTPPQQVQQQQLSPMQPPPPPLQQQHSQQQQHHSQPPPQHPPPQPQQHQSQSHSHQQQQQQQPQQQQTEPIAVASTPKAAPQQMQHQEQQTYTSQPPPPQPQLQQQPQQQQPPTIIQPANTGISSIPSSTTPPQQQQQQTPPQQQILNNSNSSSDPSPTAAEKPAVKPKHVLNPSAKPFTPRSPSTPNPSRPHTPQTPGPAMTPNVYAGPHMSATGGGQITYVMPQGSFQTPPHGHGGQGRLRRGPVLGASQLQVTAATGQPLLTAAGPMPTPFLQYQQAPHPSHYPSQPYQQMVRMYPEPPPQQIQFLAQTPPSTTPSPGQPHQQFHPGQQPSPAGGGPPAFGAAHQPHFPVMCLATAPPQLVPNYYQGAQTPHHGQQFQLIMQPSHPTQ
ncbi:ataxin-2 homolog isoform X2 [Hermetia illucens]|nr:ataxin-2 homolog isoform X2 [Hermetia illucens]